MPRQEKATSGQLVAGTGLSTLGTTAQPYSSTNGAQPQAPDYDALLDQGSSTTPEELRREQAEADATTALLSDGVHDEGNARCTLKRYQGRFLHNDAFGWLYHTGTHWQAEGAEAAVDRAIVDTLTARATAALQSGEAERHEKLIRFCIPNKAKVQGAKYLLQSLVVAQPGQFDREPDLLNCPNGVVDLRTGELLAHSASQRFLHCTSIDYRPDANADPWVVWLSEAVGTVAAAWLQLAVGYSLTGHTREEVLFYLFGPSRSGKGTFTEALLALLGSPLADVINFSTLTAASEPDTQNFNLAPLHGSRLIVASESNQYERFNEAKIKLLTGGDKIQAAYKHRTPFSYRPKYKIWLSSNQPVNADPDDTAAWGRIRVVHFPHSHLGSEDKLLKDRMKSPPVLEGVLAWAVQGAVAWYALGCEGLPEPEASALLKEQQREEIDNVRQWLQERCVIGEDYTSASSDLYKDYREWCKDNGITPKMQKGFAQALKHKRYRDGRPLITGKQVRGFYGLKLG